MRDVARRAEDVLGAELLLGVGAADAAVLATGFTSTVLFAAAVLRVVRRRGVGEGVAMDWKVWKRNGNGGETGMSLSVRIPEINDSADRQIGEDGVVRAGMPSRRTAGGEHQLPSRAPTGSTATSFLPLLLRRMRRCM